MTLPITAQLPVRTYSSGTADAHGDTAEVLTNGTPLAVHAIAPGANVEPGQPQRDQSDIAWTLYSPAGRVLHERDQVQVDGEWFNVNARPADWSRGPWLFPDAGVVTELVRVEG